jgi:hypothetical protein
MYEDDQLEIMRWEITRPCEAIIRRLKVSTGEKQELWELYSAIEEPRDRLHKTVWEIHRGSIWDRPYTVAYNAVDEAAQDISLAMGAEDHLDRSGFMERTAEHLQRAVDALYN